MRNAGSSSRASGAVTPVGNDVATTWAALCSRSQSGRGPSRKFDAAAFQVRFACEVKGFDVAQYMDRKEAKRSDLYTQYAMAASVQAMARRRASPTDGLRPGARPA
ncbi:MAG: beta-ketoacyl synthase N-terminal-like domain-containing protein [Gemmatimonadaceae bacterium]|nr:beta-ketoacyl synthase N-terminal-like domain-containing protein [Gemmatimonadaceae bacterium]